MIEFLLKHLIELIVLVFIICNTLYWHRKGFLRLVFSVSVWIFTIFIVNLLLPYTSTFIAKHTSVEKSIKKEILNGISTEYDDNVEKDSLKQEEFIEKLKLPRQIKEVLNANNQKQTWQKLGAEVLLRTKSQVPDVVPRTYVFKVSSSRAEVDRGDYCDNGLTVWTAE